MASQELSAMKREVFLAELAKDGNVSRSSLVAGIPPRTVYARKDSDPEFAAAWRAALEEHADSLEAAARLRAVEGTDKGVWHQGVLVGTEKQYSDSLLLAMLKAKRKREYGDASKIELTGADGGPVAIEETPTQIARKIAFALAIGLRAAKEQTADDGSDLA